MLIKYTNEKKNNFDVYLSENGIFEYEKKNFSFYYCHPDIISDIIKWKRISVIKDNKIKTKYELFNIGMTLYELYFNEFPFYKESDYQLYQDFFVNNKKFDELNYDPIEHPLLKEKENVRKYNKERLKKLEEIKEKKQRKYFSRYSDFEKQLTCLSVFI